ncbi:MAG: endonuclease III, partial [Candidatus Marsarchaeota archaeon]|nr:endonuclease III [Candidatus Marsarchaeota archaeon]
MKEAERGEFIAEVHRRLKLRYAPQMHTSLDHSSPWGLLVATMLSAQAQDSSVNIVTPKLFRAFKSIKDFSKATPSKLYPYVRSIGLYRTKSRNIVSAARMIMSEYSGKVPHSMEDLERLPGVGRKTANVVLSNAFGINSGIAIDT